MTRKEFNKIIKQIGANDPCPKHLVEKYWEDAKNMTTKEFTEKLDKQFRTYTLDNPIADFMILEDSDYDEEVNRIKEVVSELANSLMESNAGHDVLVHLAKDFGFKVEFGLNEIHLTPDDATPATDEKCPDALTPEIMRLLRGLDNRD